MKVELTPHVAKVNPDGSVVEFDQWYLLVDGVQWGYVSKRVNGHISFIVQGKTELEKSEVKRLVEEQIGERSHIAEPTVLVDDESDDDEEEEYDDEA